MKYSLGHEYSLILDGVDSYNPDNIDEDVFRNWDNYDPNFSWGLKNIFQRKSLFCWDLNGEGDGYLLVEPEWGEEPSLGRALPPSVSVDWLLGLQVCSQDKNSEKILFSDIWPSLLISGNNEISLEREKEGTEKPLKLFG